MRETLGAILVTLAMAGGILAIVAVIRPLTSIKLGTRKRAALALISSVVALGIGGSMLPAPTPEEVAAREQKATEERAAADKILAGKAAAEFERNKASITLAAKGLWDDMNATVDACDALAKSVAEISGQRGATPYDLYPVVTRAERTCSEAGSTLYRVDVSNVIPSSKRGPFKEAIRRCSNAYYAKASAFNAMGKVLDGDMRPSKLAEAQEAADASQAGQMLCGIGFLEAVSEADLEIEAVMGESFAGLTDSGS